VILSLVAAASENNVIGKDNALPWKLPDDMRHFREMTQGKPVIMGRKTFASIGHPLPNRLNIVITRRDDFDAEGIESAPSLDDALKVARKSGAKEACVIGGGEVYRQALDIADRIYFTRVHETIEGDAFFPSIDPTIWHVASKEEHAKDDDHAYAFTFITYERRQPAPAA
jgi:dihydrofolate reductase